MQWPGQPAEEFMWVSVDGAGGEGRGGGRWEQEIEGHELLMGPCTHPYLPVGSAAIATVGGGTVPKRPGLGFWGPELRPLAKGPPGPADFLSVPLPGDGLQ